MYPGLGPRRREGRMGIQSTQTNDKNQLQAGKCHNTTKQPEPKILKIAWEIC